MDWLNKPSWEREDEDFKPKRKVNNRGSNFRPHIIGSFHSHKMDRIIEYESLGEYLFYSLLELDKRTVRYYVQPVEIPIPYFDERGRHKYWKHVPDVLVFRQGSFPHLYQVKDQSNKTSEKDELIHSHCARYAHQLKWDYSVVHPKTVPKVVERNVKFLMGFLKPRMGYDTLVPELIARMSVHQFARILDLTKSFPTKIHPLQVLPAIYHLVAKGIFAVNINQPINQMMEVRYVTVHSKPTDYFEWGYLSDFQSTESQ